MNDRAYEPPRTELVANLKDKVAEIDPPRMVVTIDTAAGRELDVLAEALYGIRRYFSQGFPAETDLHFRTRCKATGTLQANASVPAPTQECDELSKKDPAELAWWRLQFATRFPAGQLPKPGTALIGKRFELREVPPKMVLGVDLAVPGSERIAINVVADNEVIGQVIVATEALYPNPTEALLKMVADVERMVQENLRVSRAITINQTFEDVDPDRVLGRFIQSIDKVGRAAGEAINRFVKEQGRTPPTNYCKCSTAGCPRYFKDSTDDDIKRCNLCASRQPGNTTSFVGYEMHYGPDWAPPGMGPLTPQCAPSCAAIERCKHCTTEVAPATPPPSLVHTRWVFRDGDKRFSAWVNKVSLSDHKVDEVTFLRRQANGDHPFVLKVGELRALRKAGGVWPFNADDEKIADDVLGPPEPEKQPAAEPTACDACLEVPPNGHAAHACVALAAGILDYEDQLAWLRKREAETGQRVACCTVGGIHWMAAKPCPIHEKPRAPATWVPTWDPFDYRTS